MGLRCLQSRIGQGRPFPCPYFSFYTIDLFSFYRTIFFFVRPFSISSDHVLIRLRTDFLLPWQPQTHIVSQRAGLNHIDRKPPDLYHPSKNLQIARSVAYSAWPITFCLSDARFISPFFSRPAYIPHCFLTQSPSFSHPCIIPNPELSTPECG